MPGTRCSNETCKNNTIKCKHANVSFQKCLQNEDLKKKSEHCCQCNENLAPKEHSPICPYNFNKDDHYLEEQAVSSRTEMVCEKISTENITENSTVEEALGNETDVPSDESSTENLNNDIIKNQQTQIELLQKEVTCLKRKTREQEDLINEMKTCNEHLRKDVQRERQKKKGLGKTIISLENQLYELKILH